MPKIHWLPRELCYSHDGVRFHYHEYNRSNLVLDDVVCVHRRHNEGNSHDGDGGGDDGNTHNKGRNSLQHSPNMECRMGRTKDCRSHRNMGRNTLPTNHNHHNKNHTNHTCYDSNSSLMHTDHKSKDYSNRHCSNPYMDSCSFQLSRCYCHPHRQHIVRQSIQTP